MCRKINYLLIIVLLGGLFSCKKDEKPPVIGSTAPAHSGNYLLFDADEAFNTNQTGIPSYYTSIYYSNIDGSNITKITPTDEGYYCYRASWSPDGKQVIYTRGNQADNDRSISIIDITGRNFKKVVEGDEADFACFSPDGARIAYAKSLVHSPPYSYDVYVANADGTVEQRITSFATDNGAIADIHWASDGKIYFSGGGDNINNGIYSVNPDGSNLHFIISDVYFLAVSPDAKHLLFDLGSGLYLCDIDGSNIKQIVTYDNNNPNMLVGAAWATKGSDIYLSNANYPTDFGIFRINDDGSNKTRILFGYYEYPSVF